MRIERGDDGIILPVAVGRRKGRGGIGAGIRSIRRSVPITIRRRDLRKARDAPIQGGKKRKKTADVKRRPGGRKYSLRLLRRRIRHPGLQER